MEEVDKLRFTVSGNTNGHNVVLHVYESDLQYLIAPDTDGAVIQYEEGIVTALIQQMEQHGILGYQRDSPNSTLGNKPPSQTYTSEGWICPVHGAQNIGPNFFNKEKKACLYHEVAQGWDKPEWASKDAPSGKRGSNDKFWFCKHKEG